MVVIIAFSMPLVRAESSQQVPDNWWCTTRLKRRYGFWVNFVVVHPITNVPSTSLPGAEMITLVRRLGVARLIPVSQMHPYIQILHRLRRLPMAVLRGLARLRITLSPIRIPPSTTSTRATFDEPCRAQAGMRACRLK